MAALIVGLFVLTIVVGIIWGQRESVRSRKRRPGFQGRASYAGNYRRSVYSPGQPAIGSQGGKGGYASTRKRDTTWGTYSPDADPGLYANSTWASETPDPEDTTRGFDGGGGGFGGGGSSGSWGDSSSSDSSSSSDGGSSSSDGGSSSGSSD